VDGTWGRRTTQDGILAARVAGHCGDEKFCAETERKLIQMERAAKRDEKRILTERQLAWSFFDALKGNSKCTYRNQE
jgi:hypothetical protein